MKSGSMKPLVAVIACAVATQIVIVACLENEKNGWREAAESCGKPTVRDAINQFELRALTITTGTNNVHIGQHESTTELLRRYHICMIVVFEAGEPTLSIGPDCGDAVTDERDCQSIWGVQKLAHPDVDTWCITAKQPKKANQ